MMLFVSMQKISGQSNLFLSLPKETFYNLTLGMFFVSSVILMAAVESEILICLRKCRHCSRENSIPIFLVVYCQKILFFKDFFKSEAFFPAFRDHKVHPIVLVLYSFQIRVFPNQPLFFGYLAFGLNNEEFRCPRPRSPSGRPPRALQVPAARWSASGM